MHGAAAPAFDALRLLRMTWVFTVSGFLRNAFLRREIPPSGPAGHLPRGEGKGCTPWLLLGGAVSAAD